MLAAAGLSLSSCQKNDSEIMTESVSKSLGVQLQAVNNTYSFGIGTKALKTATLKWELARCMFPEFILQQQKNKVIHWLQNSAWI